MTKLKLIYYGIIYGYGVILLTCLVLLYTNITEVTDVSYIVLMLGLLLPLVVAIIVYLGGFCWYFSIDLYKRYQTFRAIRLAKQIEKDQQDIWAMIKKLKDN